MTADSVYGADDALRRWLQDHEFGYVLTVTKAQRLGFGRVEDLVAEVPSDGGHRLSAGDRAKGPRLDDWAYAAYVSDAAPGWEKGLLIRRVIPEPAKMTFYLTLAPNGTALAELVRVAGTRWAIKACFPPRAGRWPAGDPGCEAAKGEIGLDQYEVRSWTGWHRHVTLAMLAHAYLAALRKVAVGGRSPARLGPGAAAPHRAGSPAAALAARLGVPTRAGSGARLVPLATAPSAACPPLPLATTNPL